MYLILSDKQSCIYLKKKKLKHTKLNFEQALLQALVSHYPSQIIIICWFGAQKTLLIISIYV